MLVRIDVCCNAPSVLTEVVVCINQADSKEKSQQVGTMDRIYALAHSVRIWLGSATDEEVDSVWPMFSASSDDSYSEHFIQVEKRKTWLHAFDETTSTSRLMKSFFYRAWFTRRWILQEVVLAREVIVHYGLHEVTWHRFYWGARVHYYLVLLQEQRKVSVCGLATVASQVLDTIMSLEVSRVQKEGDVWFGEQRPETQIEKALQLLELYHKAECVDERDRLYALYGLSLSIKLPAEQDPKLTRLCPVDYSNHFSHIYTNFAVAAIESGHLYKVLANAIEFGTLSQQDEGWPSWVPSWNSKRKLGETEPWLKLVAHNPQFGPNVRVPPKLRYPKWTKLGTKDEARYNQEYATRALHLRGSIRRIFEVQPSTCSLDVLAYLDTMLDRQCVGHAFAMSRYIVAWLVMLVLSQNSRILSRPGLDEKTYLTFNPSYQKVYSEKDTNTYIALKRILGLPLGESTEREYDLDQDKFLSEVRRTLQGLYPFRYDHDGSPAFGIAFAEVKTGDFVFRTAQAASRKDEQGDPMPPISGFIIRPYQQASAIGPATFRLVGMCFAYYPDMKEPELVEVILV